MRHTKQRRAAERGHAVIEIALMAPWIFLLFMALFDFGFYAYALISVQNAARVGALYASNATGAYDANGQYLDGTGLCYLVVQELSMLPNIAPIAALPTPSCSASPLVISVVQTSSSSTPPSPDGQLGTQVTVSYTTVQLFPLPWILGQMTITRVVDARVKS